MIRRPRYRFARWAAIGLVALLAGCSKYRKELVVLQPDADGRIGSIAVQAGGSELVLDRGQTAAHRDPGGRTEAVAVPDADVRSIFQSALAARPIPPRAFRLYFVFDSDLLTPESRVEFEGVFADIKARPHYDVEVVGHTDRQGPDDYNARLSLQRAERLREVLISRGLDGSRIIPTGRGEIDPLIPTADNVDEPRNRRVEITVR